jgi:hypothetical protein
LNPIDALERLAFNLETEGFKRPRKKGVGSPVALRAYTPGRDFEAKVIQVSFCICFKGGICHEISII